METGENLKREESPSKDTEHVLERTGMDVLIELKKQTGTMLKLVTKDLSPVHDSTKHVL